MRDTGRETGSTSGEVVELENEHVRVVRVRSGPREKRAKRHRMDRVLIWLTDTHEKRTADDGTSREVHHAAGDVAWRAASEHQLENLRERPVELLIIELKRSRL